MRAWVAVALVGAVAAVAAAGDDARRADLLSGEWGRSNLALDALATEPTEVAVPLLVEALSLDESFLRRRAAQMLALFGKDAAPAVPVLIQALYDEDRLVTVYAIEALDAACAHGAVPYVMEVGRRFDLRPRPGGLQNLRLDRRSPLEEWLGGHTVQDPRSADRLREGLDAKDPALRAACAEAVGILGERGRPFVPRLRELVGDEPFEPCGRAAVALSLLGAADETTVAALAAAWRRNETFARRCVADALGRIGEPAFPVIAEALEGKELRMRRWAAHALLSSRVPPAPLVGPLRAAVEAEDRTLRILAVRALGTAREHAAPALPQLVALLDEGDEEMRIATIDTLGAIGPAAAPAAPRILMFAGGRSGLLHAAAIRALGRIGAPEALPVLVRSLEAGGTGAAEALASMGEAGRAALVAAARHEKVAVRRSAVDALFRQRVQTPEVIALLRLLAKDDADLSVRSMAAAAVANAPTQDDDGLAEILARVRALKPRTVPGDLVTQLVRKAKPETLLALLEDKDPNVRRIAAFACAKADWPEGALRAAKAGLLRLLDDPEVRFEVAPLIAGLGDAAAVKPLLRVVAADTWRERRERLVKQLASSGDAAVPAAVEALDDPELRVAAAQVLGAIGPPAAGAAAVKLARLVADPDEVAANAATRALALLGSTEHVRDALLSPNRSIASAAVRAVANAPPTLRRELAATAKDDAALRRALANVFATAKDVEGLVAFARDQDEEVRRTALQGLGVSKDRAGIQVFLAAMSDPDPRVRALAIGCLSQSKIPLVAEEVLPLLERLVRDEQDPGVLRNGAHLAGRLGAPAQPLVDRALGSKEKRLRLFGIGALGRDLQLVKLLEDPDEDIRAAAATGLSGAPEALDALVKALDDKSRAVVSAALRSIEELGDKAAPAAKSLAARLVAGDTRVTNVLRQIGAPAVPFLIDAPPKERETLEKLLREIGPRAAAPLIELLSAEDAETRRKAAWALGLLGRDAEAAVPALTKALSDTGRFVATQAAWALGQIGPGAKSAIPELEKLLEDPAKREAAADALKRIKG